MLLSFVFKDSQQQHCLLENMIIECHVRSELSLPDARADQPAVSSFCPLFHFSVPHFTFLPAFSIRTARKLTNQTIHSMYTILQNKRMRRCRVPPPPPPPPIIFERLKLPQQIIYRRKGNLSESPNHQKYWENILVSRFYEQF